MTLAPVTVVGSERIDFTSAVNGRAYRVMIAAPPTPPPPAGWPVLTVLDGDAYFGFVTDATRNRSVVGREITPPLVVAVGYPDDDPAAWQVRRALDLTPPAATDGEPGGTAAAHGGLDGFLDVLAAEVAPLVARRHKVDPRAGALFGHSLGGLAVLRALFTRPDSFRSFLAVSPSIWWDDEAVLRGEPGFARRVEAGEVAPRVFIGVGALEEAPPAAANLPDGMDAERVARHVARSRMVGAAEALAARLRALRGAAGFEVRSATLANETHVSAPYAALRPALDLAFPLGPPAGPGDV